VVLYLLLVLLDLHVILLLLFLVLKTVHIASNFIFKHLLSLVDVLPDLLFYLTTLHLADGFLFLALSLSLSSFCRYFHVALAGLQDITGTLFSFIVFLPCLQ